MDRAPTLDDVADELYRLLPEQFVEARRAREAEARAAGDRVLAKQIGALGKPALAAWVANLLAREHPEEIAGLIELGGLLREAQENLAGNELRALDIQRRQLLAALTRQARALAAERGHPVSETVATQVEETLRAAMADPEAGEALAAGRLTTPLSYSGLGTPGRPELRVVPPPGSERTARAGRGGGLRGTEERGEARRRAEERRQRELDEARAAADEAAMLAEEAGAALAAAAGEAQDCAVELDRRRALVDDLRARLAEAEQQAADADAALQDAQRRRRSAERHATEAATARDSAVARLDSLRGKQERSR